MEASLPIVPEIKYSLGLIWGQWKMYDGLLKKYCLIMCKHCFGLACQHWGCNADNYLHCALWHIGILKKSIYILLITRSFRAFFMPLLSEHWYWHFKLSLMHLYWLNVKCEHWMRKRQIRSFFKMSLFRYGGDYVLDACLHNSKCCSQFPFFFLTVPKDVNNIYF